MKAHFGHTKLLIVFSSIISIVLVVIIAINADSNLKQMADNNRELYNAFKIAEHLKIFQHDFLIIENKHKGFLITGDSKFLEEYRKKERDLKSELKHMEPLFKGRAEEDMFLELAALSNAKLQETMDLHSPGQVDGFGRDDGSDIRHSGTEKIVSKIEKINSSLNNTSRILIGKSREFVDESKKWNFLEISIGVIIALLALFVLLRDIEIRNRLERELRLSKNKAEENAILKEQFMANMSHEIRTPMNAILGFSDLLQKTPLAPDQQEFLTAIRTSGSNLLHIINDVLDFSKIEAGKFLLERVNFNLQEVLKGLEKIFSMKASEKNIQFTLSISPDVPKILSGDPTRLTQIITNLLNNAVKFTKDGSVNVTCELVSSSENKFLLRFKVKDTGIGIAPEKQKQVFERFNQADANTTRLFGGTGLGLAIVKSLVEMQNGSINVNSRTNEGSEFIVELPFDRISEQSGTDNILTPVVYPKKGTSVLLVEDNDLNQKLTSKYLEAIYCQTEIADNGLSAIEKCKTTKFDLILMDIQMPLLDGYQAARKIRQDLKLTTPIIAMTAHVSNGEKQKCIDNGMDDYISKPFTGSELTTIIAKYLPGEVKNSPSEKQKSDEFEIIDLSSLRDMSRGDAAFLSEMIDLFLEKNPQDMEKIHHALQSNDFDTINAIVHRTKTSVGFMGMRSILPLMEELEILSASRQDPANIKRLVAEIERKIVKGREELRSLPQII